MSFLNNQEASQKSWLTSRWILKSSIQARGGRGRAILISVMSRILLPWIY